MQSGEEYFPVVTEDGAIIGKTTRSKAHAGSFLLHPVVHLHVFNPEGELYLQKRALDKDIQPGKWDTAVGGHVQYGEEIQKALRREVLEELGIKRFEPAFAFRYPFKSAVEYELVHTYYTVYNGIIKPNPDEISEGKFWKLREIDEVLGHNILTPNFEREYQQLKDFINK